MDAKRVAGLCVAQAEHVDGHEHLAHRLRKARDRLQHEVGLRGQLGLRVTARRGCRDILEVGGDARPARRGATRIEVGVVQRPVQVAEVVLAAHEPRPAKDALIRLLHEILGVLAGAGQRPRCSEQPVEVVAERLWIEWSRHRISIIFDWPKRVWQKPSAAGVLGDMASHTSTHRTRNLITSVTALAVTIPAIIATPIAGAQSDKVDGVRAVVQHGALVVKGGDQDNHIALRLAAGNPAVIQVDVGDDGSPQFSFARSSVDAINLKGGDGNDSLRIDDANGAFTDTIAATIAGGDGNDTLEGGQTKVAAENETYYGGDGNDLVDGGKGADTAYLGSGEDTFR